MTRVAVIGGGVSGLACGLALRDRARERGLDLQVTVFEKEAQPGGNLRTLNRDGWQFEWGPNGFLDNEPATLRLVDRLGLRPRLLRSSDATRRRFLLVNGRLEEIPLSPKAFLGSRMLSLRGKLRLAGELLVPARKDLGRAAADPSTDETIDRFGERRLGREFADIMLDPMVKGVFGGEAKRLSLAAAFPRMVELEKNHGGLFRADDRTGAREATEGTPHRRGPDRRATLVRRRDGRPGRRPGRGAGRRPGRRSRARRRHRHPGAGCGRLARELARRRARRFRGRGRGFAGACGGPACT